MRDAKAAVLGIAVVVGIAFIWGALRRPGPGMKRVSGFQVEVDDHREGKRISVRIPGLFVGGAARAVSRAMRHGAHVPINGVDWGDQGSITPREILEAADKSRPGAPAELKSHDGDTVQVQAEGAMIRLTVRKGERSEAVVSAPRALIERLAQDRNITPTELLRRIDEMGPGDLVTVHSEDADIRLSAR